MFTVSDKNGGRVEGGGWAERWGERSASDLETSRPRLNKQSIYKLIMIRLGWRLAPTLTDAILVRISKQFQVHV